MLYILKSKEIQITSKGERPSLQLLIYNYIYIHNYIYYIYVYMIVNVRSAI